MDSATVNKDNILSDEVIDSIYAEQNIEKRTRLKMDLRQIAKSIRRTKDFDDLCEAREKIIRIDGKSLPLDSQKTLNYSSWPDGVKTDEKMRCGSWIADDLGVRIQSWDGETVWACKHPIMPVERLRNLQTNFEKMKIAWKRSNNKNAKWRHETFRKDVLSSQNKIVNLSNYGILVNSENSKNLVKFFTDVEAGNLETIPIKLSSSKFGWVDDLFLPFDTQIEFDAADRFTQLVEAIKEHGDYEEWLDCIKKIRLHDDFSVRFMIAASFASVLLEKVGALPFFADLWGNTEGGKTVTLMVCASIWADPSENKFIGDFKSTDVALEAKADALNNLPMLLDDTSKVSAKIRDNFEGFVYDIASGKGKSRSDKDLGIRYENNWRLIVLTTGEAPLNGYVNQGGAINRILEINADKKLFNDPQHVCEVVRGNYGFAGKKFIDALKKIGDDKIKGLFKETQKEIEKVAPEKMQKQVISLAAVLTADRIATDYIFKDKKYLEINDSLKVLIDPSELSVNERGYEEIVSIINQNISRFNPNINIEQWGVQDAVNKDLVYIYPAAFENLCKQAHVSKKSFCDWAIKRGYLEPDSKGNAQKVKKISNKPMRMYFFMMPDLSDEAKEEENKPAEEFN